MTTLQKQSNYHFKYSVLVDNTRQEVWGFLTNVHRWSEWDTELKSAHIKGKFGKGAKGILIPKRGPKLKFYISEVIPNSSYTFVTKMPIGTLEIKRTLDQEGGFIKFTDDIRFTGFLKRFFGLLLGSGFKAVLPQVMVNFKKLVEQK